MFNVCLGYLKSTQLLNTYANTIQNLFIVFTQLCIYYAMESSAFPSDQHPMYSLCIKAKQLLHSISIFTFISNKFLSFTQCYVYSMLYDETYLQPMYSLCDILIQLYHEIKVTQLLHRRIMQSMRFLCDIPTQLLSDQAC